MPCDSLRVRAPDQGPRRSSPASGHVQQEVEKPALPRREGLICDRSQVGQERACGACRLDAGRQDAQPGDDHRLRVMFAVAAPGEVRFDQTARIVPPVAEPCCLARGAPAQVDWSGPAGSEVAWTAPPPTRPAHSAGARAQLLYAREAREQRRDLPCAHCDDLLRHTPAGLRVIGRRQVSWLAGRRLDPPSRTLRGQWHVGSRLTAYSCGGSSGLGPSLAFQDRTGFPLRPNGHRRVLSLRPLYRCGKGKCCGWTGTARSAEASASPAACLNQARSRRTGATSSFSATPHWSLCEVSWHRSGAAENWEAGERPALPPQRYWSVERGSGATG